MTRFRCPECGSETRLEARHGDEIVSIYCLNHTGGVDGHLRPVYMTVVPKPVPEWRNMQRQGVGSRLAVLSAA